MSNEAVVPFFQGHQNFNNVTMCRLMLHCYQFSVICRGPGIMGFAPELAGTILRINLNDKQVMHIFLLIIIILPASKRCPVCIQIFLKPGPQCSN